MSRPWCLVILLAALGAGANTQVPLPPGQIGGVQTQVDARAERTASDLRARAEANRLGGLSTAELRSFDRLNVAIRQWKQDVKGSAVPLVAEGVLLDCLSRLEHVRVFALQGESGSPFTDYAAQRSGAAAKAFDAALKIDPTLIEARMRRSRIRAPKEARARAELEAVANDPAGSPVSYLAAISRAALAQGTGDTTAAARWYQRARALVPGSIAAAIGLHVLQPGSKIAFATLDPDDLYYRYPCSVLTPGIQAEWMDRAGKVVLR